MQRIIQIIAQLSLAAISGELPILAATAQH
jgi:hypothetical protein